MTKNKRFGDLGFKFDDVQDWVCFDQLIGQEITVLDYLKVKGEYGFYCIIKYVVEGEGQVMATTTGGKVIMEKLDMAKEQELLPMAGTVIKEKRWYDIR